MNAILTVSTLKSTDGRSFTEVLRAYVQKGLALTGMSGVKLEMPQALRFVSANEPLEPVDTPMAAFTDYAQALFPNAGITRQNLWAFALAACTLDESLMAIVVDLSDKGPSGRGKIVVNRDTKNPDAAVEAHIARREREFAKVSKGQDPDKVRELRKTARPNIVTSVTIRGHRSTTSATPQVPLSNHAI